MHATPAEIARKALADHLAALPAAELLKRYAARRDPEAFAGLVQQFGSMVFGVCRRVLGQAADADDAFQAVFLSLARQADSLRDATALPAWLHRVALRVAHKALARRAGSIAPPETVPDPTDPFAEVAWKDVRRALDEELDALPDKYRGPVVLCWLDGLTQDEAARRLGTSLATLKRRLDAGRELLRARLVRRGLAPVLSAGAVLDATGLTATVPDALSIAAITLGFQASEAPSGVGALETFVAVAEPGRRYLRAVAALALAAGVAVVALSPEPPTPPNEPAPKLPDSPRTVELEPDPRPVAAKLPPRVVPRNRMTGYVRGSELWWSPNGKLLAAITSDAKGENERVTLWDAETCAVRTTLGTGAKARGISSLAFDPTGTTIAVGHSDGTIRFWNVATGKETDALRNLGGPVSALAWSADGALLAFHTGNALTVWDVRAKKSRSTPRINEDKVTALAFAPDASALAALAFAKGNKTSDTHGDGVFDEHSVAVLISDVNTGTMRGRHEFSRFRNTRKSIGSDVAELRRAYFALTWSTDGRFVTAVCPSFDAQELVVLDAGTGKVREYDRTAVARSHTDLPGLTHISPDGRVTTRGAWKVLDHTDRWHLAFKTLDTRTGAELATLSADEGLVVSARFSPDGRTLACAFRGHSGRGGLWEHRTDDRTEIRLYDVETGTNRHATFRMPTDSADSEHDPISTERLMWSRLLATLDDDYRHLCDPATGKRVYRLPAEARWPGELVEGVSAGDGHKIVYRLPAQARRGSGSPSPDGRFEARWYYPENNKLVSIFEIWDVTTKTLRVTSTRHERGFGSPKWSRDGRWLAVFAEGEILVWDVENGKLRDKIGAAVDSTTVWAFSPDGKAVIFGHTFVKNERANGDGFAYYHPAQATELTQWNVDTGRQPRLPIRAVGFVYSPDGKYIAYTDDKGAVRVWDIAAGREYAKLDTPACGLHSGLPHLVFSPDSATLAYLSQIEGGKERNRAIQLWDVATKRAREPLIGHFDVTRLAWTLDSTTLASFNTYEFMLWDVSAAPAKK